MRNWFLFHLYGGDAIVSLLAIVLIVVTSDVGGFLRDRGFATRFARVGILTAVPFGALTGTPVPLWLTAILIPTWLVYSLMDLGSESRRKRISGALLAIMVALAAVPELLHVHGKPPRMSGPQIESVVVLGDSLTSGGFGEISRWTDHLSDRGFLVVDLSAPSATTESALQYQVPEIRPPIDAVVLELGGNDMLDGASRATFESNLRAIIDSIRERAGSDQSIYYIEFPVLPGKWSWAAAQRRVAREKNIVIIPKRVLTRALLGSGNTLDGLHLTDRGHEEMADSIEVWLHATTSP